MTFNNHKHFFECHDYIYPTAQTLLDHVASFKDKCRYHKVVIEILQTEYSELFIGKSERIKTGMKKQFNLLSNHLSTKITLPVNRIVDFEFKGETIRRLVNNRVFKK